MPGEDLRYPIGEFAFTGPSDPRARRDRIARLANGYTRFKLALTEPAPAIKPYQEARWAELSDGRTAPVPLSLELLEALHRRWVFTLAALTTDDWSRTYFHPGEKREITLDEGLALYAWHGEHHAAHITSLRHRRGWS
jgi:hypothetical protein